VIERPRHVVAGVLVDAPVELPERVAVVAESLLVGRALAAREVRQRLRFGGQLVLEVAAFHDVFGVTEALHRAEEWLFVLGVLAHSRYRGRCRRKRWGRPSSGRAGWRCGSRVTLFPARKNVVSLRSTTPLARHAAPLKCPRT
jgi:hypothetical protein